jgi:hypothetical protein
MDRFFDIPPSILGPRQNRAVRVLVECESIPVSNLGPIIGALNPRQTIMELRNQGFFGIIRTRRMVEVDRDGKICRPGEYYIPPKLKHFAIEALKKYATLPFADDREAVNNRDTGNDRGGK